MNRFYVYIIRIINSLINSQRKAFSPVLNFKKNRSKVRIFSTEEKNF